MSDGFYLKDHQKAVIDKIRSGCILCGGVGSGKSKTALYYYFSKVCGGKIQGHNYSPMTKALDLYIITTAKKRDDREWNEEALDFLIFDDRDLNVSGNKLVIDSWNNINKYVNVENAFFIFDEQRVVGYGMWSKSFIKIAHKNKWILLTATPGDNFSDYIPVFIANGFYKNKTEFERRHIVYNKFVKFPKIERYLEVNRLIKLRNDILVDMPFERQTVSHDVNIFVNYDKKNSKIITDDRWNIFEDKPIKNISQLCYLLRKISNSDPSRIEAVKQLMMQNDKTIIFYNFDYELEILRNVADEIKMYHKEWNGHKHDKVPEGDRWSYFVNYSAGSEGWNCITTNVIIFYSLSYSYKSMIQASGRINRLNTPYKDLYYYYIKSKSPIDLAIQHSLDTKRDFNERTFLDF